MAENALECLGNVIAFPIRELLAFSKVARGPDQAAETAGGRPAPFPGTEISPRATTLLRGGAVEEICADGALYFSDNERRPASDMVELLLDEDGFAEQLCKRGRARAATLSWSASASALGQVLQRIQ